MLERVRLPSLAAISAFEAAARHGSFAAAARELGTTAASVSYHVRRLELAMDARLFRRFPHRVELTGAGEAIADDVIGTFETLRACFARGSQADESHLSITALPTFGTSWLTPRLGRFRQLHPHIQIDVDLSPDAQDLNGGAFDVAIRNGNGRWPGLKSTLLIPSIFMPLRAPSLAIAPDELTRPDCDVALLGRADWWERWFRSLGLEPRPQCGIHLADEHLDAGAAIAGHGVTIGSPILFRADLEAGRLVPAHNHVIDSGRSFWLAYPVGRRDNRKIRAFEEWLIEEASAERSASRRFIEAAVAG